jgi:two-component system response regulator DegU
MMKIMIVDDNATVRRIIRRAVSEIADEVFECSDGAEVLPFYAECLPDLVLMDIRMPRVDGLAATSHLKTHFPRASVFIVTDIDDEAVRSAAMEAGACGYALKQNLIQLDELILAAVAKNTGQD